MMDLWNIINDDDDDDDDDDDLLMMKMTGRLSHSLLLPATLLLCLNGL
jgi:hypothetical protein